MRQKNTSLTGETQKQCLCGPKKSLAEKFGKKSGGGEQSKGCGAVRRVAVCPPTRPYFPANSTHNKRPFYPHNNLAFPHSPHHPFLLTRATPSPPGGAPPPPQAPPPLCSPGGRPGALSGAIFLRCGTVCYQGVWAD